MKFHGLLVTVCLALSACDSTPRTFFNRHKVGESPDYAVVKWGRPDDHVATVHGFLDDLGSCLVIAEALNKDSCKATNGANCRNPFSCQPLNHE